jgi:hypothetical protein
MLERPLCARLAMLESGRRNRATYTPSKESIGTKGSRNLQGVSQHARLHKCAHSVLLSVAVFAGLSGPQDLIGLPFLYLLAPLSESLKCRPSCFAQGKTS